MTDQPIRTFLVSADHRVAMYRLPAPGVTFTTGYRNADDTQAHHRVKPYGVDDLWIAQAPSFGMGHTAQTPQGAIRDILVANGCTGIRIVETTPAPEPAHPAIPAPLTTETQVVVCRLNYGGAESAPARLPVPDLEALVTLASWLDFVQAEDSAIPDEDVVAAYAALAAGKEHEYWDCGAWYVIGLAPAPIEPLEIPYDGTDVSKRPVLAPETLIRMVGAEDGVEEWRGTFADWSAENFDSLGDLVVDEVMLTLCAGQPATVGGGAGPLWRVEAVTGDTPPMPTAHAAEQVATLRTLLERCSHLSDLMTKGFIGPVRPSQQQPNRPDGLDPEDVATDAADAIDAFDEALTDAYAALAVLEGSV